MACRKCGAATRGHDLCQPHRLEKRHGDQVAEKPLSDGGTRSFSDSDSNTSGSWTADPSSYQWRCVFYANGRQFKSEWMDLDDAEDLKEGLENANVQRTWQDQRPLVDDGRVHLARRAREDGGNDE